jgi:hypothetical protein
MTLTENLGGLFISGCGKRNFNSFEYFTAVNFRACSLAVKKICYYFGKMVGDIGFRFAGRQQSSVDCVQDFCVHIIFDTAV